MEVIIIILLVVIGYQLIKSNELKKEQIAQKELEQRDKLLEKKFPNIFLEARDAIIEYQEGLEKASRIQTMMDEAESLAVYDEPVDIVGYHRELEKKVKETDDERAEEYLKKLMKQWRKMQKYLSEETEATESEKWFIGYNYWKTKSEQFDENSYNLGLDLMDGLEEIDMENFLGPLYEYKKWATKK